MLARGGAMAYDKDTDGSLPHAVSENIEAIAQYYARHEQRKSVPQAVIERFSLIVGSPGYVAASVIFIVAWIAYNVAAERAGLPVFDEPPFFWLQGIVGVNAFIISTTVLIRQNHAARLAAHHAHLDLQVNLLTEKKSSKIIELLEQLRRDIPIVENKEDTEVQELKQSADARAVLDAIEQDEQPGDTAGARNHKG